MSGPRREAEFFLRHRNVYVYVPNIIGYIRIVCALYSFGVSLSYPVQCIVFYFFSFVCDELDGRFARQLNQTSTLGAVLDMVTDRLATTGLLLLLAVLYPKYIIAAVSLVFLDIFSHWFQMYATLLVGATTHKDTASSSWLVRMYYKHRLFMGFCCCCCELLYLCLYGLAFEGTRGWRIPALACALPTQLLALEPGLGHVFSQQGMPLLGLLALVALPGVLVKQICNIAQLRTSAAMLVQHDLKKMKP
ncbi:phosphatidylinositol synthase [Haematococcus lacustris]